MKIDYKGLVSEKFSFIYIYSGQNNCDCVENLMLSKLENFSKLFKGSRFHAIDLENNPEVTGEFSVFATPTLLVYSHGKELLRYTRFFHMEEIKKRLDKYHQMIFHEDEE